MWDRVTNAQRIRLMTVSFIGKRHESKAFELWFTISRFYQISGYMT